MDKQFAVVNDADKMSSQFMVAEFGTLTSRVLGIEQTRATRINFYIVLVTTSIGGLSLIIQAKTAPSLLLVIIPAISFVVFFLGIATLREYIELAAQTVFLYRRAGRIRKWFSDKNPSILPYLAWTPGDDTPPFKDEPGYATFAGKDSILWFGNSLSGAAFAFSLLSEYTNLLFWYSLLIAVIVFMVVWIAQNIYINYSMKVFEKIGAEKGRIHFPRAKNPSTYPKLKRTKPK